MEILGELGFAAALTGRGPAWPGGEQVWQRLEPGKNVMLKIKRRPLCWWLLWEHP